MRPIQNLSEINLAGKGIHSGQLATLKFSIPKREQYLNATGPRFFFPGFSSPLSIQDLKNFSRTDQRSTLLQSGKNWIRTPEHLLAALLFFSDAPVDLYCDASELPCLDGSALAFRNSLSVLFPQSAPEPIWQEYTSTLNWTHEWKYGFIQVEPAEHFSVESILSRGNIHQSFTLNSAKVAWQEILPARTFAFYQEWIVAGDQGLMQGADLNSGLLLADSEVEFNAVMKKFPEWGTGAFPILNHPGYRMDQELVKHKILDLLGDLALFGLALPKLKIVIQNGGHSVNHLLLEKLSRN